MLTQNKQEWQHVYLGKLFCNDSYNNDLEFSVLKTASDLFVTKSTKSRLYNSISLDNDAWYEHSPEFKIGAAVLKNETHK